MILIGYQGRYEEKKGTTLFLVAPFMPICQHGTGKNSSPSAEKKTQELLFEVIYA